MKNSMLLTIGLALVPLVGRAQQHVILSNAAVMVTVDAYGAQDFAVWEDSQWVAQTAPLSIGAFLFLDGPDGPRSWNFFGYFDPDEPNRFTPLSHGRLDARTARTVYAAGDSGLRVSQTVSIDDGLAGYRIEWRILNTGAAPAENVRFLYGGDVMPGGELAVGGDTADGLSGAYAGREDVDSVGLLLLLPDAATPADRWALASSWDLWEQMLAGWLEDNDPPATLDDIGYALQWNVGTMAPGGEHRLAALHRRGPAVMLLPLVETWHETQPGVQSVIPFGIRNFSVGSVDLALAVESAQGTPVHLLSDAALTVASGATYDQGRIQVDVPVATDLETDELLLTIQALGQDDPVRVPIQVYIRHPERSQYDVTPVVNPVLMEWVFNAQRSVFTPRLRLGNGADDAASVVAPFFLSVPETGGVLLVNATYRTDDGQAFLDLTDAVIEALRQTGNRDDVLDPGETVSVDGIEIFSPTRQIPQPFEPQFWGN